jgi:flavin reductase (DIM6/NTAB) family NADH-FMN oxidoreductase RutF/rubredoxin
MDNTALYKIGYGLYILTSQYGGKDNGCVVNTVLQVTSAPPFIGVVTVNKQNFTHDIILKSKIFNISILTTETPFDIFKRFGYQSGADVDKFAGFIDMARSENGLIYLTKYTNAYLSFSVTDTFDFGTHTMFKAAIGDGKTLGAADSVTYAYYQQYIKPKPQTVPKGGYRCKICGYVYDGAELPNDFTCPVCKHGAADFEKIE